MTLLRRRITAAALAAIVAVASWAAYVDAEGRLVSPTCPKEKP